MHVGIYFAGSGLCRVIVMQLITQLSKTYWEARDAELSYKKAKQYCKSH